MNKRKLTPPLEPDTALDWPTAAGEVETVMVEIQRKVRRRRRRAQLRAAAAFAVVALGTWSWRLASRPTTTSLVVTVPARQVFADGTIAELNSGARIRTHFTAAVRQVELLEGEAHFQVTKDEHRTFLVVADGITTRAVGTAFSVKRTAAMVEVLVTEGRVAIDRTNDVARGEPAAPALFLEAGKAASVALVNAFAADDKPQVDTLPAVQLAARLAWRVPRLEFSATPLNEALAAFNRHSPVKLVLREPALAKRRLSGIVRADNTAALLQLLETDFGLTARPGPSADEMWLVRE